MPSVAMDGLSRLEAESEQLAATIKSYINHRRDVESSDQLRASPDANIEASRTKSAIHASIANIKTLLGGPVELLQDLARQIEMVACFRWLAEYQILACIPAEGSMSIQDLADLAGVPEIQLRRVIRLMGTSGFLQEPMPNYVSHTPLSAQFVTNQSWLDAAVFMAELAAPTALHMPTATHQFGGSRHPTETAYNLALNTLQPFGAAIQERPKLGRQWSAYLHHVVGLHQEKKIADMLSQLKWSSLGSSFIVEVGAQSTSMAHHLANKFPTLHLIVQIDRSRASKLNPDYLWPGEMMNGLARDFTPQPESSPRPGSASSSRVTVTYRSAGMPQPVVDAAVYILHVPVLSTGADGMDTVKTELQDYLGILRATGGILLIPTANLLPEPGSLSDPNFEAVARTRDLNYLQLANEGEMEMTDLFSAIETTRDGLGRLVITNQLRSHNGLTVCLTLKHETYC
ncbi:hypothetical protein ASPSYDRAFT_180018 [Aspergillus sydowii CBS 593.65]|uniref:O-methyltransferase domain-containing protein n=1 Tax=Aspergillus sydowii CBS 593.65 TaxID=1036612 RepID=A0A1L9TD81_9EURO|nr:uncharacterized protein ASPSYDRAFT_180018 [Aspergillus sydowii CBS 593.65]OJJ57384.1 hypothetical protein ASPSYDRAFT_180018 [Aspergillus sydowii CBS 593.65]